MTQPLLLTKLRRPPIHQRLILRPALLSKLEPAHRLTLVSAPPGFGKTVVVSQWLDSLQDVPVAWLSLDEDDNDPARFWRYVLAALDDACPGHEPLSALQAPHVSTKALVSTLINHLSERAGRLVLVLDDYHVVRSSEIHAALSWLLDHQPEGLRLVLTSRVDPPLPLARLRARGQLLEIRASDLRFDAPATEAFLGEVMGVRLAPESVQALAQRTEGWAAGLQLAGLSLQDRPDPDRFVHSFAGSHRYIMDYLVEEVLERQEPDVQAFLLETSVLDRLGGSICDAITGGHDSQERLEQMESANLLLVPLDDDRQWFRYHHLFADMLRHILARRHPDRVTLLNQKAAAWFEAEGHVREAITYYLRARDHERVATLLPAAESLWRQGEVQTLLAWLEALPESLIEPHLRLLLLKAWALVPSGRIETLATLGQQARRALERMNAPEPGLQAQLMALEAHVARWQDDAPRAVQLANWALAALPAEDWMWRGIVTLALAASLRLSGELAQALEAYDALARECRHRRQPYYAIIAECMRAGLLAERGALGAAQASYERALAYAAEFGGADWDLAGYAMVGLGEILRERGQVEQALEHLRQGIETGAQLPQVVMPGTMSLVRLYLGQGDTALASEVLARASESLGGVALARRLHAAGEALFRARTAPVEGLPWIPSVPPEADAQPLNEPRRLELSALARLLLRLERPAEARQVLESMGRLAEATGRTGLLLESLVLGALGLAAEQRTDEALSTLERALSLGMPEGYRRLFLDEGAPMQALLQRLVPRLEARLRTYAESLCEAPAISAALIEDLSEREREVLRLLERGTTNQEIADTLGIELSTAKKHCSNILGKLGTSNRTQAVARARELGLL